MSSTKIQHYKNFISTSCCFSFLIVGTYWLARKLIESWQGGEKYCEGCQMENITNFCMAIMYFNHTRLLNTGVMKLIIFSEGDYPPTNKDWGSISLHNIMKNILTSESSQPIRVMLNFQNSPPSSKLLSPCGLQN